MTAANGPARVAVIGGGITGLAAAHRLRELRPTVDVAVFESSGRLGGVLHTEHRDGWLLEHSADNFITNVPWANDLCRRLGIDNTLLPTDEGRRRALVVCRGRLYPVPAGFSLMQPARFWPLVTTPILSLRGKLRLLGEYFVPPRRAGVDDDESLADFAIRRLGREAFERLVQPLVGGIYTADAHQLSLAATLPRFVAMEQKHGSLIRATLAARGRRNDADQQASGARYSLFVAPRDGMQTLVDALATRLPAGAVRLNSPVTAVQPTSDRRWQVAAGDAAAELFDALILAAPAPQAARLLDPIDAPLADALRAIPYAGASIALAGYRRAQIAHPLDGFGFVVPAVEGRRILAGSFASNKYPGRAPDGQVLVRVFLGGALQPELLDLDDEQIRQVVREELAELLGVEGEPTLFEVCRWQGAMPQYHLGHVARVRTVFERVEQLPGLELAGNAYHGVGVPQCIHSGEQAAERLLAHE